MASTAFKDASEVSLDVFEAFKNLLFSKESSEDIDLAANLETWINNTDKFELCVPRTLALCVFRLAPQGYSKEQLNALNKILADRLNERNDLFFTPTSIPDDIYVSVILQRSNGACR